MGYVESKSSSFQRFLDYNSTMASLEWDLIDSNGVNGRLKFVSVGRAGVWGVNEDDNIYNRSGTYENEESAGTNWVGTDGRLKQISSGFDIVWGVAGDNTIWYRSGISSTSPLGTSWHKISGKLKQVYVSSSSNQVWGVSPDDGIYRRTGITESNPSGTDWEHISGKLKFVSVGRTGVWGVSSDDLIWFREGTFDDEASVGTEWIKVDGGLKQISSGDLQVWGVASNNTIHARRDFSGRWEPIALSGGLDQVYTSSSSKQVWGVNTAGDVYRLQRK